MFDGMWQAPPQMPVPYFPPTPKPGKGGFSNETTERGLRWVSNRSNFLLEILKFMPKWEQESYFGSLPVDEETDPVTHKIKYKINAYSVMEFADKSDWMSNLNDNVYLEGNWHRTRGTSEGLYDFWGAGELKAFKNVFNKHPGAADFNNTLGDMACSEADLAGCDNFDDDIPDSDGLADHVTDSDGTSRLFDIGRDALPVGLYEKMFWEQNGNGIDYDGGDVPGHGLADYSQNFNNYRSFVDGAVSWGKPGVISNPSIFELIMSNNSGNRTEASSDADSPGYCGNESRPAYVDYFAGESGKNALKLATVMLESRRRAFYAMSELFGVPSWKAAFDTYKKTSFNKWMFGTTDPNYRNYDNYLGSKKAPTGEQAALAWRGLESGMENKKALFWALKVQHSFSGSLRGTFRMAQSIMDTIQPTAEFSSLGGGCPLPTLGDGSYDWSYLYSGDSAVQESFFTWLNSALEIYKTSHDGTEMNMCTDYFEIHRNRPGSASDGHYHYSDDPQFRRYLRFGVFMSTQLKGFSKSIDEMDATALEGLVGPGRDAQNNAKTSFDTEKGNLEGYGTSTTLGSIWTTIQNLQSQARTFMAQKAGILGNFAISPTVLAQKYQDLQDALVSLESAITALPAAWASSATNASEADISSLDSVKGCASSISDLMQNVVDNETGDNLKANYQTALNAFTKEFFGKDASNNMSDRVLPDPEGSWESTWGLIPWTGCDFYGLESNGKVPGLPEHFDKNGLSLGHISNPYGYTNHSMQLKSQYYNYGNFKRGNPDQLLNFGIGQKKIGFLYVRDTRDTKAEFDAWAAGGLSSENRDKYFWWVDSYYSGTSQDHFGTARPAPAIGTTPVNMLNYSGALHILSVLEGLDTPNLMMAIGFSVVNELQKMEYKEQKKRYDKKMEEQLDKVIDEYRTQAIVIGRKRAYNAMIQKKARTNSAFVKNIQARLRAKAKSKKQAA